MIRSFLARWFLGLHWWEYSQILFPRGERQEWILRARCASNRAGRKRINPHNPRVESRRQQAADRPRLERDVHVKVWIDVRRRSKWRRASRVRRRLRRAESKRKIKSGSRRERYSGRWPERICYRCLRNLRATAETWRLCKCAGTGARSGATRSSRVLRLRALWN